MPVQSEESTIAEPRRRRRWLPWASVALGAVAVVVTVVALTGSSPVSSPERGTPVSGQAPAFELEGLRDPQRRVSLADFRGRPVVVNFFASWCAPCRREMPAFEAVHQELEPGVAFVGIDTQDIRSDGLALLEETEVSYPAGFDPDGDVAREFGVLGMPTTVFIAADGQMREQVTGEMSADWLRATIERLFPGVGG